MSSIIEVNNLKKSYSDIEAVKGITFSVEKGTFFAFLGENGAGKSTTINIMSTLLKKTSGEVIINGHKVDYHDNEIRKDIGVVFQGNMLDKYLTVRENIISRGKLYGLSMNKIKSQMNVLSEKIGITKYLDRPYRQLSGGLKRRADIVRALINEPKLLILDEPTTGLDPYTRKCVWETIIKLKEEKELTIFLTTHYMDEAAGADYIVVIDSGQIKAKGTPESLRLKYSFDKLVVIPQNFESIIKTLNDMNIKYTIDRDSIIISLINSIEAIDIIVKLRDQIEGFEVIRGNMDDMFINIIGQQKEWSDMQ